MLFTSFLKVFAISPAFVPSWQELAAKACIKTARVIIDPPTMTVKLGTSLMPNIGTQTQKIPPPTSVKDSSDSSAAGIALDPIEYKISPKQTKVP